MVQIVGAKVVVVVGGGGGSGAVEEGHGRKRSLSIVFCNFN